MYTHTHTHARTRTYTEGKDYRLTAWPKAKEALKLHYIGCNTVMNTIQLTKEVM